MDIDDIKKILADLDNRWVDGQVGKTADDGDLEFQIAGSGNNNYMVTRIDGTWECTCPHFTFRGPLICKHMKRVKEGLR